MKEDTSPKKPVKKLGTLNLDLVEKLCGGGPSYQDYINSLPPDDLKEYANKHRVSGGDFTLGLSEKKFKTPDFNWLDLSLAQIKSLTDDELQKLLSGEGRSSAIRDSTIQLISNEILIRQIRESSKPHWTVTPTFIVGCLASVLAAISILVTIYFSVYYKAENNNKHTDQSYAIKKNSSPE